jgi:hypothetical protein
MRAILVLLLSTLPLNFLAADQNLSMTYEAKEGAGKGKHLVFLIGDEEYRSEEGLPMIAKILSQRHGFKCTLLFPLNQDGTINPDLSSQLSDPSQIDSADGVVMMLRFRAYPDDVMKKIASAINRGIPIIGLRTSTHAFRFTDKHPSSHKSFNNFGRQVLGEGWVSHWGPNMKGLTKGIIDVKNAKNLVLNGVVNPLGDSGVYEAHPVSDATILMYGQVLNGMKPDDSPATWEKKWGLDKALHGANEPMMPVAWIRENKAESGKTNRVFCSTYGAATDFLNEDLRRLVINSVYWGFNLEVPTKADVTYVDEYKPAAYGAKTYRKGIKPEDHAIGKVLKAGLK